MLVFSVALALGACSDLPLSSDAMRDSAVVGRPATPDSNTAPAPTPPGVSRWSDRTIWPDSVVPTAGADVTIPQGRTVLLDVTTPALGAVHVLGTLAVDTVKTHLRASTIYVRGALLAGTEDAPHRGHMTITLLERANDPDPELGKGIIVYPGARLELFGERRTSWVRLGATANAGATQITLERATDWRAGDRIVIASSSYTQEDAELRAVVRVEGPVITLDRSLARQHYGDLQVIDGRTVDQRAEVGLLSRSILIEGDSLSAVHGHGGHVMVLRGGVAHVDGIELYRMGQRDKLARYPFHWHMAGAVPGQYFRNSSVWRTFNRCVTIHGTHEAHVENNVCYDHEGHGYFLEDGIETGNTLRANLGLTSRVARLIPSDRIPANFWITNPDNTFERNVGAGSTGVNFWVAPTPHPTGMSATDAIWPINTPLRRFVGNVGHSSGAAFSVDGDPETNGYYHVDVRPRDNAQPTGTPVMAVYEDIVGYKTRIGFWGRGDHMQILNGTFLDNGTGVQIADASLESESEVKGTLIVGRSALSAWPDSLAPWNGFLLYDGNILLDGVTFAGFDRAQGSYAVRALDGFGGRMSPRNRGRGLRFVDVPNDSRLYLVKPPKYDGERQAMYVDLDGSLAGRSGASLVNASDPFAYDATCETSDVGTNVLRCGSRRVAVRIVNAASDIAPAEVTRDDGLRTTFGGYQPRHLSMTLPVGRTYAVRPQPGAPLGFTIEVEGLAAGEQLTIVIPWVHDTLSVKLLSTGLGPVTRVFSLDDLRRSATTAVFLDETTDMLHVRTVGKPSVVTEAVWVQNPY